MILSTRASAREAESRARELLRIPEETQMERASLAAWSLFRELFPEAREVAVACGPGSNGGDGLALARHALLDGIRPIVEFPGARPPEGSLAALQLSRLSSLGVAPSPVGTIRSLGDDVAAVDALFGTGLSRPLEKPYAEAARELSRRPTLSLDIPSGLDADTGRPLGEAVRSRATLSFGRAKPGLFLDPGRTFAGEVRVDGIGIPPACWEGKEGVEVLDGAWARRRLPARRPDAHKGDAGRCLLLCGSAAYRGAMVLSARAALRSGAGLVVVASSADVAPSIALSVPEAMGRIVLGPGREGIPDLLPGTKAVLAGPGTGQAPEAAALLSVLFVSWEGPLALDADALNLLAGSEELRTLLSLRGGPTVLTPHPGEAARLMDEPVDALLADPLRSARRLCERFGAVVVLKTSTPVVASPDGRAAIGVAGHWGMATGGCGDALAGALVARLAEGEEPYAATCQAVRAHARAGDLAGARGRRGMSVEDLVEALPPAWEEMETA